MLHWNYKEYIEFCFVLDIEKVLKNWKCPQMNKYNPCPDHSPVEPQYFDGGFY